MPLPDIELSNLIHWIIIHQIHQQRFVRSSVTIQQVCWYLPPTYPESGFRYLSLPSWWVEGGYHEGGRNTKKTRQEVKDKDYDRRASTTSDVEPCCGVLIDSPSDNVGWYYFCSFRNEKTLFGFWSWVKFHDMSIHYPGSCTLLFRDSVKVVCGCLSQLIPAKLGKMKQSFLELCWKPGEIFFQFDLRIFLQMGWWKTTHCWSFFKWVESTSQEGSCLFFGCSTMCFFPPKEFRPGMRRSMTIHLPRKGSEFQELQCEGLSQQS